MKRYVISDPHFGHTNIIRYESRPFPSLEAMDAAIIYRWNDTVHPNDLVFVLGDVSFYPRSKTKEIIQSLHGRKYLIMGNHDKFSVSAWRDIGFEFVSKYPIIVDEFYVMSHAPVYMNDTMPYLNIHGHTHSRTLNGNYYNVCVETQDYTPVLFDSIKRKKA